MGLLCVIPARGGSKRIPRKNIRLFCGRPIIAWSISAANQAACFERLVVSTDDAEIADIARAEGADVPFLRPRELADDFSGTAEVVRHAIEALQHQDEFYEGVCCLYATAPFVRSDDILSGLTLWRHAPAGSTVFTATTYPFPIQRALRIDANARSHIMYPEFYLTRSQDLEEAFHDAGQFYWSASSGWHPEECIYETGLPLLLPRWRVQDIDTLEDWKTAELMHRALSHELG